ncbi:uncharacterized protein LOC127838901 isoform X2 [Dreissena polymorpha]|uniref:uncharacterized protein LOC127838901 isoform X2 n=1 Tax=Dreissena polymorpha TaxID=45954 RepID=UPI002264D664|nr:uncharacterized protein LOC127838901 isoform X2 [Dreissena polymorpha]
MYKKRKRDTEYNVMGSVTESETGIIKEFESSPKADINSASSRVGPEITNSDQTLDDVNSVCVKVETDEWYNAAAGLYSACAKSTNVLQEEKHHDENNKDGYHLVHEQSETTGCLEMDQDVCTSADVKAKQIGCVVTQQDATRQAGFNSVCVNRKQTPDLNVHQNVHPVLETAKQSVNPNTEQRNITRNGLSFVCGIEKQYINTNTDKEFTTANDHAKFANIYSVFVMRDQTELSNENQYCGVPTYTNSVGVQTEKINHYCTRYVSLDLKWEREISVQQQNPQMESVSHGQVAFGQVKTTANYLPTRSSGSGSLFLNMLATTSANQCPPCANSTYVPTNMNAETSNEETSSTHQLSPSDVSKDADDKLLLAGWYAVPSKNEELLENSNEVVKSRENSSDDFEKIFIERNTGIRKSSDSTQTVCDPGSSSCVVEPRGASVRDTIASVNSKKMSTTANRFKPLCKDDGNFDQPLEKDVELERFFTKQELDKMTFHEQKRLKKIVQNYEIMCDMGLPAIKPDFMKGHAYQAKAAEIVAARSCNMNVDKSVSDSKEDLTPDMERKKQTKGPGKLSQTGLLCAKSQFLCTVCGRQFRFPWQVKRHKRIHTGEKPFKCDVCGKIFNQINSCQRHMMTHKNYLKSISALTAKLPPSVSPQSPSVSRQSPTVSPQSPIVSPQSHSGSFQSPSVSPQSPIVSPKSHSGSFQSPSVSRQSPIVSPQSHSGSFQPPSVSPKSHNGSFQSPSVGPQLPSSFQSPSVSFQSPSVGFQSPSVSFQSPSVGFQSPSVGFQPPSVGPQSPRVSSQSPSVSFQSPSVSTQSPSVGFQSPSVDFQSPSVGFQSPSVGFQSPSVGPQSPSVGHQSTSVSFQSLTVSPQQSSSVSFQSPGVSPQSLLLEKTQENSVKTTVPVLLKPAKRKLDKEDEQVKKVKIVKIAKTLEKDNTEYSLQERNQASCMNLEPPDDDHLLYCGECNKEFEGDCPVHGPYNYMQDKKVPEDDPNRADHTLPDDLEIKASTILGAGLGVFSKVELASRTMFGPYGGDIINGDHKSGYCWQIYKEGKASHFVDAQNKATSNWMRYVNCAMTEADQNLVAFQYKGCIYYCTFKPVSPGEELLVWYGDEYARELGLIRDKNLLFRPKYVNGEEIYHCVYCKAALTTAILCVRHLRKMHGGDKLTQNDLQVLDQWLQENDPYNNSSDMKTNMGIYTEERLYKCEVCGYECNQSYILKKHMRIHTGERPYKCEVCGYECNRSYNLKMHMRMHTGEKRFICEVCGYACAKSSTLKTHMRMHTGEGLFKCEVCGYACKQSFKLKTHMSIHTGERPYKCDVCGYEFNQKGCLKMHMRIHTGEKPYTCEVCGFACKQRFQLKTHMRKHTGERPYKCEVCGYACYQSGTLKKHMRTHTGERQYICEVCGNAFNTSDALKTHIRTHTGERLFKCEVCGNAFTQSGSLKTHMLMHTEERLFKCEVCGYACNQRSKLKTHLKIHTGERPYKCDVCGYAFNQGSHLMRHLKIHAGESLFKCEVCSYACKRRGALKTHMRMHTGESPFTCEVCGYAFYQRGALKTHMRIHTGDEKYKCEVCGYACNLSVSLKKHMRIHTGERPNTCEVSGNAFNKSNASKTHIRTHTGKKLFKCEVCGNAFTQNGTLKTHMLMHTGERLFKCEVCGYACNQRSNLKAHIKIHTGEKPYKCDVCGYACNQRGNLKRHMRIHTGETVHV